MRTERGRQPGSVAEDPLAAAGRHRAIDVAGSLESGAARFDALVACLTDRPSLETLRRGFTPPSRFRDKRFDDYLPQHPSQAAALDHLRALASRLDDRRVAGLFGRIRQRRGRRRSGTYLDGGFGVGKTHLLAALWNEAPGPKAYLSFDELMYFIGLVGPAGAAGAFRGHRLLAVDEWELDDPGNLTIALAFLRRVVADGAYVAVTSNTLPLELGAGRFSQKDFLAEIEELASAFGVVRVDGEDFRHRSYEADPGRRYFRTPGEFAAEVAGAPVAAVAIDFGELVRRLAGVHPIRYREFARGLDALYLAGVTPIPSLPDALRWVHFVDSVYDAGTRVVATGEIPLAGLFPEHALGGPYAKKLSRCLSRLEELLA